MGTLLDADGTTHAAQGASPLCGRTLVGPIEIDGHGYGYDCADCLDYDPSTFCANIEESAFLMPNPVGQPPAGGYGDPVTSRVTVRMGSVLLAMLDAEAERRGVKRNRALRALLEERLAALDRRPPNSL